MQVSFLKNQLSGVTTEGSQCFIRLTLKVILRVSMYITTKNMTAQGVCRGPVSRESMVPIVTLNVRMEK